MMKKFIAVLAAIVLVFSSTASFAAGEELAQGMGQKFFRGVVNTFTGWVEFPVQIMKGYDRGFAGNEDNKILGVIVGIFAGIGHSAGRTASGVTEMVTFWAADHESNDGIGLPLDAEYAWEEGEAYDMFSPNLMEGAVVPVGNKLLRGLGDSVLGFVELPGQIVKGVKLGAPDLGIIKGLWYWTSRQVDGAYYLYTFLLPNPKDTKALAFDEEWPWTALADNL